MKSESTKETLAILHQQIRELEEENKRLRSGLFNNQQVFNLEESRIIKSLPFVVLLLDVHGKIIENNEIASKFFKDYIPDFDGSFQKLSVEEFFDPKTNINPFIKKVLDGQNAIGEFLVRQIQKEPVWLECFLAPVYKHDSRIVNFILLVGRDNSDRKITELAIRESQELYRSLIELSPEGIIIINKGKIEFANREFIKMLKVEREKQIIERKFLDLIMLKDHAKVRKWLNRVEKFQADEEVILAEIKRFDDTSLFAEVMATPITIRGEKSAQLVVRDVTQRKLTEKELSKERELNENLIRSIPDYIYFKDTAGRFIKINKSFARVLGLEKPEDAVGKSDKDFFGVKHFQLSQKEEKQIIRTKKPLIGAIRKEPWPNEEVQWVSVTKMPLYGPNKEIIGVYGVSRDITRQKLAEEEIRQREERFRLFFSQIQIGMAIINSNLDILEVNNALCIISKRLRKDLISKKIITLFENTNQSELKENIKNVATNQSEIQQVEVRLVQPNGKSIFVIFLVKKLEETANIKDQMLCQVIDIHDLKKAEEQLKVRNSELNNFVFKVSHDLRSPLNSVKGLINLIRMEQSTEMKDHYIGMIEERVEKLDGFIRDLLSHSKSLNAEVSFKEVNLKQIIDNCFAEMEYHPKAKAISKKVDVKGVRFFSDELRIQEIMRNLISNAIFYSAENRANSFIKITARCGEKSCTITVEDNGIGIKKEYLDKIFQMFYRANNTVEGTGIGLYIVQQSINKLGGDIQVESKLNSGTKFSITLPNNIPEEFLN